MCVLDRTAYAVVAKPPLATTARKNVSTNRAAANWRRAMFSSVRTSGLSKSSWREVNIHRITEARHSTAHVAEDSAGGLSKAYFVNTLHSLGSELQKQLVNKHFDKLSEGFKQLTTVLVSKLDITLFPTCHKVLSSLAQGCFQPTANVVSNLSYRSFQITERP